MSNPKKHQLTESEIEMIRLLAAGNGYKQIGGIMFRSKRTIEAKALFIKMKMGCTNMEQVVASCIREQIIN